MNHIEKLNVTIYSCDRPVNFLKQTVDGLIAESMPNINVQHGSDTTNNLDELVDREAIHRIKYLQEASGEKFMEEKIIHRANRNLAQAFLMPDADGGIESDILILEDDVVPCKNLKEQLKAIYWLIQQGGLTKYIVALYNTFQWGPGPQGLMVYPPENFYGLQAVLYSGNIRKKCSKYHFDLCDELPADFVTKRIATENRDIALVGTRFSLFQHIGSTTTGLGDFHRTINFLDGQPKY